MGWRVEWREKALKDLERLDRKTRERILCATERLAETGYGDVRELEGRNPPEWRLRVGDWRVLFTFVPDQQTILFLRVRSRGSAYKE